MGKRFWPLALSMALLAGAFSIVPAAAQAPGATGGVVPETPNIVDPAGDANGHSPITNVGGGGSFTGLDVLAGWMTHDATNVYMHIQTTNNARAEASTFQTNVGNAAGQDCIQLRMTTAGAASDSFSAINSTGDCGDVPTTQFGELLVEEGPDGTAILTGTYPRAGLAQLADGQALTEPNILVGIWGRGNPVQGGSRIGTIENTAIGTDYSIASDPVVTDPGKPSKPKPSKPAKPAKKPKKPKKPKPPAAPACSPYVPGELGGGAPISLVTTDFTEEKPLEVPITSPSTADGENVYQNIQVGPGSDNVGLFARYEFPVYDDHDIYLYYASGTEAAHAGGYNPAPVVPTTTAGPLTFGTDGTGSGGHSEQGAEQIDGISTGPCGGYTLEMHPFHSMGGDMVLKLWLGPVENEPAEDGAVARSAARATAADMFFGAMKMRNPMADSAQASGTPAANKGCTKGGGKKKGCKKPPVACAPVSPAAAGADKPTVVVTDAATAEAPLEQAITLEADFDEGLRGEAVADHFNVLVDSASPTAGLYVAFEFPMRRDYDLWTYWPDNSVAASSHGFNPLVEAKTGSPVPYDVSNTSNNHAGESLADSENIIGLITPDCGGWTLGFENYFGEGGEFKIKLWLGEGTTEPKPQGEETR